MQVKAGGSFVRIRRAEEAFTENGYQEYDSSHSAFEIHFRPLR